MDTSQKINLTETEATIYGVSVFWLRRARWTDNGPAFIKIAGGKGGKVLYPVVELDRFFGSKLVKSTKEASVRDAAPDKA